MKERSYANLYRAIAVVGAFSLIGYWRGEMPENGPLGFVVVLLGIAIAAIGIVLDRISDLEKRLK